MEHNILWNWQQKDWPHFTYEPEALAHLEQEFIRNTGIAFGISKHFSDADKQDVVIELMSNEAYKTSEIEGELLDRASLQSSIKRHFGLQAASTRNSPAENGIAEMMMDLYHHFDADLTHDTLWNWHSMLMNGRRDLHDIGCYRTHPEAMQVVSGYLHKPIVHFEAPPSHRMMQEMEVFIQWFRQTSPAASKPLSPVIRAGMAHLYFVSIHPFEDGNGRIGRALVERVLAEHSKQPTLIALSQVIQDHKKHYYDALEVQNKHNHITEWLLYFGDVILRAQRHTIAHMEFIIQKTRFFDRHKDQLNPRQVKVVERLFRQGPDGFKGGLSAKNYISIAKTSASTATRDLQDLVDKNILVQTGERKATRYWLTMKKQEIDR